MTIYRICLPVIIALQLGVPALAQQSATAPPIDPALKLVNDREVSAFLATDATTLGLLWADDFVVTNPLNRLATKPQVLAMVKGGTLSFKSYERRIEYVHRYGDIAVLAGVETVEWAGKMPLAGSPRVLRFTAVWRWTKQGWQEIARHANVLPPS